LRAGAANLPWTVKRTCCPPPLVDECAGKEPGSTRRSQQRPCAEHLTAGAPSLCSAAACSGPRSRGRWIRKTPGSSRKCNLPHPGALSWPLARGACPGQNSPQAPPRALSARGPLIKKIVRGAPIRQDAAAAGQCRRCLRAHRAGGHLRPVRKKRRGGPRKANLPLHGTSL